VPRAVIVRHGDTFAPGDVVRRIGARTDLPLVASGRAQALALRAHLPWAFDRVLAAPLRRTQETAALIAGDAEPAAWLAEIDHGPDEGRPEAEVRARLGDALHRWEQDAVPPPGWHVDAAARTTAWAAFLRDLTGTALLVTSNGAARFALLALGERPAKLRTGAYGVIEDLRVTAWDVRP
jgi:broad specificity phosphatase PhoE